MSFTEQRAEMAARLERLEDLLRQAQGIGRSLEEYVDGAAKQTDSFADDTLVAQVAAAVRRSRQELGALIKAVSAARAAAQK